MPAAGGGRHGGNSGSAASYTGGAGPPLLLAASTAATARARCPAPAGEDACPPTRPAYSPSRPAPRTRSLPTHTASRPQQFGHACRASPFFSGAQGQFLWTGPFPTALAHPQARPTAGASLAPQQSPATRQASFMGRQGWPTTCNAQCGMPWCLLPPHMQHAAAPR